MSPAGVAFRRSGTGDSMVLIHGIGGRAQTWDPVRSLMAHDADLLAVDLPGFNGTTLGDVVPTVSGFADAIEQLLRIQGLRNPTIAGSSLGGAIALELGRRGVASSVIAFSPIGFWRRPGAWWCRNVVNTVFRASPITGRFMPLLARFRLTRILALTVFYGRPQTLTPKDVLDDFEAFRGANILEDVNASMTRYRFDARDYPDIPVAIAWGTRDIVLPARQQSRRARRLLPRATHVQLTGCGHLPFNDDPETCRQVLLGRFARVPSKNQENHHD